MKSRLTSDRLADFHKPDGSDKIQVVKREGHTMAVIRPSDPERAIRRAHEIKNMPVFTPEQLAAQDAAFQGMLGEQEYQFVGVQGFDPKNPTASPLLDPDTMEIIGEGQTGDSLISYEAIKAGIRRSN